MRRPTNSAVGSSPTSLRSTEGRGPSGTWWPGSELEEEPEFADVQEHDVARLVERSRADYLGVLGTMSTYLQLEAAALADLLTRIGRVLPATVTVEAPVRLHLARRR